MKYKVTRTSEWDDRVQPCEGVVRVKVGDSTEWQIEINTLEELTAFIEKNGKVVLGNGWMEIYDDYRE